MSSNISSGGEIDGVALEELGQRLEVHRVLLPWDWHLLPPDHDRDEGHNDHDREEGDNDHDREEGDNDQHELPDEEVPHALNTRCSNGCNLEIEKYDAGRLGGTWLQVSPVSHTFESEGMFAPAGRKYTTCILAKCPQPFEEPLRS